MKNWKEIKIRDLLAASVPGEWGKEGSPDGGVPVLRSTNFRNNGYLDYSDIAYREVAKGILKEKNVGRESILIEKSGGSPTQAAGRVAYCDRDFNGTASNFIEIVKVKDCCSPPYVAFLLYYLYKIGRVAKYQQQTTGIINFKLYEYYEELVCCPTDKFEQTKIAQILSTMDRTIEQTEALIAKQQRIKNGLMQDLLTCGIDEHGNLRSEETHQFKDSPLGRIPVEWEVEPCMALCRKIVVGIVIRPAQYYRSDGVSVLRSANVQENKITDYDMVYMSNKDNEALSKSKLYKGDLVTVRTGYPGTTAVISSEYDGCNCVDIVISRPNHDKVRSDFLSIWINSDYGKKQVLEGQGGLAQQHFNIGEMRTLLVKVPDLFEQQRIEKTLTTHGDVTQNMKKHLLKLRTLKTALMQDLLTGEKRVTTLLDNTEATS